MQALIQYGAFLLILTLLVKPLGGIAALAKILDEYRAPMHNPQTGVMFN